MSASASSRPPGAGDLAVELTESIQTILKVLRAVANGNLTEKLEVSFPETHPVGALAASVNSMMEALSEARSVSANYVDELSERIALVERQREAIRSLSTPIIELWSGVLCVPIVGVLDSARASELTTALLSAVVEKKAAYCIIDVTGIEVMDTQSADHFLRVARAVTLLGSRCLLSGVHPNIARTIVHMGVELEGLESYRTMRDALKQCVLSQNARKRREMRR